jgi:hypothetical protein
MKRPGFTQSQIAFVLRQAEEGTAIAGVYIPLRYRCQVAWPSTGDDNDEAPT